MPLTPITFEILLSLTEGPGHGWGIRREVESRTDGAIRLSAGTLYTGIQRLERDGLIEECPCPPDMEDEANSRWRFYRATDEGRKVLGAEAERMRRAVAAARRALAEEAP